MNMDVVIKNAIATTLVALVFAILVAFAINVFTDDETSAPAAEAFSAPVVEPFAILKGDPHPAYLHCINGDVFAITGNSITPIYLEMQSLRCSEVVIDDAS